jgi:outer membrane protein TolC
VLGAAALLAVRVTVVAASDLPLTLTEAQRLAVERSTKLVARQSAGIAAREMAVAAGRLPDPVASLRIENLPVTGEDRFSLTRDFMTMRSIGVMQEITRADKREARSARFEREAEKSGAERAADAAAIRRDTALAWLDRYYADAMSGVIAEQQRAAADEIAATETAFRAGRGSVADVLAARAALIALDDRASDLAQRGNAATIGLARFIGDAATAPLAGRPDIDSLRIDPRTLDADIRHHPQIAVLDRREALAAAEVAVAQTERKPDWTLEVMYSQRGPAYSNMISVGVSVPLPWDRARRQDRDVAAKLALLDEVRAERDDMLRAHAAEVRSTLVMWQSNRERSARYSRELLPVALERTQAVLAAWRGAKASLGDVLAARRGEIDVRMQALQLEWDAARAWAELEFLDASDAATGHAGTTTRKTP